MPDTLPLASEWVVLAGRLATIESNQESIRTMLADFIQVQRHCNEAFERRHEVADERVNKLENERIGKIEMDLSAVKTKLAIAGLIAGIAVVAMVGIIVDMLTHGGKFVP